MDPDTEDVFLSTEDPSPLSADEAEEDGQEEEEDEDEDEDEEEDSQIFNAWMQRYRGGQRQEKVVEGEDGGDESERRRAEGRSSAEPSVPMRVDRRASLPCPATLSAMQLSRLHLSTRAPVTARFLQRRSSSRRLLTSPQEACAMAPERRPSLIPTIPEVIAPERRAVFRRRNVMSLNDADSVCLICHHDLSQGTGGTRELQCTHTFHKECIEEWLWGKQSCPTCHVQVSTPRPVDWSSARVKVP